MNMLRHALVLGFFVLCAPRAEAAACRNGLCGASHTHFNVRVFEECDVTLGLNLNINGASVSCAALVAIGTLTNPLVIDVTSGPYCSCTTSASSVCNDKLNSLTQQLTSAFDALGEYSLCYTCGEPTCNASSWAQPGTCEGASASSSAAS
jgi:hypothetical protein